LGEQRKQKSIPAPITRSPMSKAMMPVNSSHGEYFFFFSIEMEIFFHLNIFALEQVIKKIKKCSK
jgi:hypothetical protein